MASDLSPEQVNIEEYDAVIVPGGKAPDRMRINSGLVKIVKEAYEKGKVLGAVCHGPQMLIEADVLRGKKVTGWKSVAADLRNAGATFIDSEAVVDGKIVTSRSPADLPRFCKEMLRLLGKQC
jgi:protease I